MQPRALFQVLLLGAVTSILAACSASVSYKPPLLPVKFVLDSAGNISIVGESSLVTFVGEFSIGAQYMLYSEPDSITVIIRDRKKGNHGFDTVYRIRTGRDEFSAVLNGETTVQVVNKQVLIDVTNADIKSIEFRRADNSGIATSSGFWGTSSNSYRPFKVMQKFIDQGSLLGSAVALILFPIELLALPLAFIIRLCKIDFGDIGAYGVYFIWMLLIALCDWASDESDEAYLCKIVLLAILFSFIIISFLLNML